MRTIKNLTCRPTIADSSRSVLTLILLFLTMTVFGQGNLLIMPRRVVFEGGNNSIDLTLVNTGNDTARYVVSMVQMRMNQDGSFDQILEPDSGQYFADKFLRFFPRAVNLAPNESQLVKMQVTRSDKLIPGEYRSHVYFRAVPKMQPLGEEAAKQDSAETGIAIKLQPIFGITIPAIIRIGENTTKVTFSDLAVERKNDTTIVFNMVFNRSGNMSVYGDVTVDYISPDGNITRVNTVRGIAVYTPLARRSFFVTLEHKPKVNYSEGKLRVVYSSPADIKPFKFCEAVYELK